MELTLLVTLVLGVLHHSLGCTYTPSRQEVTVFGTRKYYCDYTVQTGNVTAKLSVVPGSRFRTNDCFECHCTNNGLQCCGYGIRSKKLVVPNQCRVLPDGCQPRVVLKSDNKTECLSKRPVDRTGPTLHQTVNQNRGRNPRLQQRPQGTASRPHTRQIQGHQGQMPAKPQQQTTTKNPTTVQITRPAQPRTTPATTLAPPRPSTPSIARQSRARTSGRMPPRFNPWQHRMAMTEENMQLLQNLMLMRVMSSGNVNPMQGMFLMNLFSEM